MTHGESYLLQSVLLGLSWIGAYLRDPRVLGSFWGYEKRTEASSIEPSVTDLSVLG
jgi:hypothetical protein